MKKFVMMTLVGFVLGATAAVASTTREPETQATGICCSDCEPDAPCQRFCWRDC
ncbi:hypothetical protein [Myxococcus stipitatus]|nr:hypothetical protein [Myxococcus stipitatus]